MKKLFYMIVTNLTNVITGLDNTQLKLWNFGAWISASNIVTKLVNGICFIFALTIALTLLEYAIALFYRIKRKINERKLNIVED